VRGDEARVIDVFCAWLEDAGWKVRREVDYCDVVATRGSTPRPRAARPTPASTSITTDPGLDVDVVYGQLLRRIPVDGLEHRLGVVVPTGAVRAALRVDQAVRDRQHVTVYEVTDDGEVRVVPAPSTS
jgi:hypothetical protein